MGAPTNTNPYSLPETTIQRARRIERELRLILAGMKTRREEVSVRNDKGNTP